MKSKILTHAARIAKCILIAATLLAMLPLAARADKLGDYPITVTYEGETYDLTITVRNKIKGLNFDNVTCDNLNKHLHELPSGDVTVICENNSDNYTIDFSKMELDMDNYSDGIIAVISYQDYKPEEPIEVKIS